MPLTILLCNLQMMSTYQLCLCFLLHVDQTFLIVTGVTLQITYEVNKLKLLFCWPRMKKTTSGLCFQFFSLKIHLFLKMNKMEIEQKPPTSHSSHATFSPFFFVFVKAQGNFSLGVWAEPVDIVGRMSCSLSVRWRGSAMWSWQLAEALIQWLSQVSLLFLYPLPC